MAVHRPTWSSQPGWGAMTYTPLAIETDLIGSCRTYLLSEQDFNVGGGALREAKCFNGIPAGRDSPYLSIGDRIYPQSFGEVQFERWRLIGLLQAYTINDLVLDSHRFNMFITYTDDLVHHY